MERRHWREKIFFIWYVGRIKGVGWMERVAWCEMSNGFSFFLKSSFRPHSVKNTSQRFPSFVSNQTKRRWSLNLNPLIFFSNFRTFFWKSVHQQYFWLPSLLLGAYHVTPLIIARGKRKSEIQSFTMTKIYIFQSHQHVLDLSWFR